MPQLHDYEQFINNIDDFDQQMLNSALREDPEVLGSLSEGNLSATTNPDSYFRPSSPDVMSELKFHGLLELACSVLGFEVGEIWQVKNHDDGKLEEVIT